jgi:hypothetical protein
MSQPTPQEQMARMLTGHWVSQMIYVAARLGIADQLAGGPKTADQLAQATGAHALSLYRLLRALASLGIFSEGEEGRFTLTPLAETLRADVPASQRATALMMVGQFYEAWGDLLGSVRTGEPAFDRLYGRPVFDYLAGHPELARLFDAAMRGLNDRKTVAMLDAYDLSGIGVLADIGGGDGSNLIGVLQRYPRMRGVLFDLPHVVERAGENPDRAGVSGRCEAVGGSFFEAVPGGADAYLLRHIIHDWDDERASAILKYVREAMPGGAKLLVVEHVLPPGNEPSFGKLLDLSMLLIPGGVERTEEDFRRLFESAGFRLTRVVPTAAEVSVIEGRPG